MLLAQVQTDIPDKKITHRRRNRIHGNSNGLAGNHMLTDSRGCHGTGCFGGSGGGRASIVHTFSNARSSEKKNAGFPTVDSFEEQYRYT